MNCHIPSEAERLEKYFAKLNQDFPYISEEELQEVIERPCKWAKLLEERMKDPDVSGE